MSLSRRVAQVEAHLPPREAVLRWLAPLLEASEYGEYVALRADAVESWTVVLKQVKDRVRERARGRPKQEIEATERVALKDTLFLLELVDRVNKDGVEHWSSRRLHSMLLLTTAECLPLLELQVLEVKADDPSYERWWQRFTRELEVARQILTHACEALLVTRLAIDQISQRYFAGHPILFAGAREQLALGEHCVQILLDAYTATMRIAGGDKFDPKATLEESVTEHAQMFVDFARADTLTYLGEEHAADQIVQRYLRLYRSSQTGASEAT